MPLGSNVREYFGQGDFTGIVGMGELNREEE